MTSSTFDDTWIQEGFSSLLPGVETIPHVCFLLFTSFSVFKFTSETVSIFCLRSWTPSKNEATFCELNFIEYTLRRSDNNLLQGGFRQEQVRRPITHWLIQSAQILHMIARINETSFRHATRVSQRMDRLVNFKILRISCWNLPSLALMESQRSVNLPVD